MFKKYGRVILSVLCIAVPVAMIVAILLSSPGLLSGITEQDGSDKVVIEPKKNDQAIDINTVDYETLLTLPDMTKEIAVGIIEYREEYRRFRSIDDLLNVDGVTPELLEVWESYICCT